MMETSGGLEVLCNVDTGAEGEQYAFLRNKPQSFNCRAPRRDMPNRRPGFAPRGFSCISCPPWHGWTGPEAPGVSGIFYMRRKAPRDGRDYGLRPGGLRGFTRCRIARPSRPRPPVQILGPFRARTFPMRAVRGLPRARAPRPSDGPARSPSWRLVAAPAAVAARPAGSSAWRDATTTPPGPRPRTVRSRSRPPRAGESILNGAMGPGISF